MYLVHPRIPVEIISIGVVSIRWYSLMYILGFLFFYFWTKNEIESNRIFFVKKNNQKESIELLSDLLFYMMLGVILGGRLGYVMLYNPKYYFIQDPLAILRPWEGGMSFHGAFIGTYIFALIGLNHYKMRRRAFTLMDFSDITLVSVPAGLAFGRIGNFINGELYGRPTAMPWGMLFPSRPEIGHSGAPLIPIEEVQSIIDKTQMVLKQNVTEFIINGKQMVQIPRHPSQIYHMLLEGLLTLMIQMILYYKVPASKYRGFLTGTFLISYGFSRVFTEFFRQPDPHIGYIAWNFVTVGMLYSLPMILIGVIIVTWSIIKKQANLLRVK